MAGISTSSPGEIAHWGTQESPNPGLGQTVSVRFNYNQLPLLCFSSFLSSSSFGSLAQLCMLLVLRVRGVGRTLGEVRPTTVNANFMHLHFALNFVGSWVSPGGPGSGKKSHVSDCSSRGVHWQTEGSCNRLPSQTDVWNKSNGLATDSLRCVFAHSQLCCHLCVMFTEVTPLPSTRSVWSSKHGWHFSMRGCKPSSLEKYLDLV